jgi:hypothetical protein
VQKLLGTTIKGEFEHEGRSKILFLHSRVTGCGAIPCRLERKAFERQFQYAAAMTPAATLPLEVLARCWLPRELARRWIEAHGYCWPSHLDPRDYRVRFQSRRSHRLHSNMLKWQSPIWYQIGRLAGNRSYTAHRARSHSGQTRARSRSNGSENGYPVSGDAGQAKLEKHIAVWLTEHGHRAAASIIRKYIKSWIA